MSLVKLLHVYNIFLFCVLNIIHSLPVWLEGITNSYSLRKFILIWNDFAQERLENTQSSFVLRTFVVETLRAIDMCSCCSSYVSFQKRSQRLPTKVQTPQTRHVTSVWLLVSCWPWCWLSMSSSSFGYGDVSGHCHVLVTCGVDTFQWRSYVCLTA